MGRPKGSKKPLSEIDLKIKQLKEQQQADRKKAVELKREAAQKRAKEKADKGSFTEKLIQEVKMHGCLWDKSLESYRNKNMKDQAYSSIGLTLNRSAGEAYDSWKNLVDSMRRHCENESKSGDGLDDAVQKRPSTWKYYESMIFLRDANFRFRESQSNFDLDAADENFNFDDPITIQHESPNWRNANVVGLDGFEHDQSVNSPNLTSSPCTSSSLNSHRIPDPPSNPSSPRIYKNKQATIRAKKRSSASEVKAELDSQIGMLAKFLNESDGTPHEKFLSYLGDTLSTVPPSKLRRCERDILVIADAYADGNEQNINMVIECSTLTQGNN